MINFLQIKIINKLGYLVFVIAFVFAILCSLYQPLIGDDYGEKFKLINNEYNYFKFLKYIYFDQTGRLIHITFSYFIYSNNYLLFFYKIISIPIFFLSTWFAWYLGTDQFIKFKDNNFWKYFCFAILLWLSVPAINEIVIWSAGAKTYLWPLFISLLFLSLIKFYSSQIKEFIFLKKIILFIIIFILGFLSGNAHEQISVTVFIILLFFIIKDLLNKKKHLNLFNYFALFSVLIGFLILIIAPGNYARLESEVDKDLLSHLITFIFYFFSAFFKLASEDKGITFWLSILIIFFLFNSKFDLKTLKFRESYIWLLASLIPLLVIAPISSSASLRTTFFSYFFMFIFALKLNFNLNNSSMSSFLKNFLILILSLIFFFDSFSGYLSNKSFYIESKKRMSIIENAINKNHDSVKVPYFETIPSRLTYMQTPFYDEKYLKFLKKGSLKTITIDKEVLNNFPFSKNPLKHFKFMLEDSFDD